MRDYRQPLALERLSPHLFWDVDIATLDLQQHTRFIIRRVMDRGSLSDVKSLWRYYGATAVKEAMISARSLDPRTLAFCANQFRLPRKEFRAFAGAAI